MGATQRRASVDPELEAMAAILGALDGLDGESIQRVLDYVLGRLSLPRPSQLSVVQPTTLVPGPIAVRDSAHRKMQPSVRDL